MIIKYYDKEFLVYNENELKSIFKNLLIINYLLIF